MKKVLAVWMVVLCVTANANIRHYQAKVETSEWQVPQKTRLRCELSHKIPGYGTAKFVSYASKQLNMEFDLDMYRLPKTYSVAAVYSVPPSWMPGKVQRAIADMPIRKQFDGDLPEKTAWTMLSELEKGYWPTLYYQDWYSDFDKVAVGLNASNFSTPYVEFVECVANLLPFGFDDIAYTVLSYQKNSVDLTKYSKKRLSMIGEYLKEDQTLDLVLLDGYTDSYGGTWTNKQLSIRRANEIKDYFASLGVDPKRIQVTGHGERRHISPNTHDERGLNRRVVIRMTKP